MITAEDREYASEISKLCDDYGTLVDVALDIYIRNGLGRPKISDLRFLLSLCLRLAAAAQLRKSFPEECGR